MSTGTFTRGPAVKRSPDNFEFKSVNIFKLSHSKLNKSVQYTISVVTWCIDAFLHMLYACEFECVNVCLVSGSPAEVENGPAVWCMVGLQDFIITGCENGTIEVSSNDIFSIGLKLVSLPKKFRVLFKNAT